MLFSAILSLFAATSVFAQKHESKACTRELEGIVYVPSSCAYNYLNKISNILRVQSPLLWTSQASSVINTFQATYGVYVAVVNTLGQVGTINPAGVFVPFPGPVNVMTNGYARSNALGEGFSANLVVAGFEGIYDVYSSIFWNVNGEMYTIGIAIESSKAPNFC